MNSIRPLFTIAVLGVVAIYLYLKINEAPLRPVAERTTLQETADGVPPLEAIDSDENAVDAAAEMAATDAAEEEEAPAWDAEQLAPESTASSSDETPVTLPSVPEIPPLPNVAPPADAASSTAVPEVAQAPLPNDVPATAYANQSPTAPTGAESASDAVVPGASVPVPPLGSATAPTEPGVTNAAPPQADQARSEAVSTNATAAPVPSGVAPSAGTFAASWPAILGALEQGELARAHKLLSPWYRNPSLTPAEKEQVETLLSQLAGTVVYSTEHQLHPAHVVQPGETLETIAAKYNVPWQLLAKVNGVATVDGVQAGQQLKVMQGPFSAVLNLAANEVSLDLDGRYAGRFPVSVPTGVNVGDGEWMVMQKIDSPHGGTDRSLLLRPLSPSSLGDDGLILGAQSPTSPGTTPAGPPVVNMSAADANEIVDILSVGSRVVIRR